MLHQFFASLHVVRIAAKNEPYPFGLLRSANAVVRDEALRKFLERVLRISIHANGYDVCVMADADGLCIF